MIPDLTGLQLCEYLVKLLVIHTQFIGWLVVCDLIFVQMKFKGFRFTGTNLPIPNLWNPNLVSRPSVICASSSRILACKFSVCKGDVGITHQTVPDLSMEQRAIVYADTKKNCIVTAGAGSGKTFTMLRRIQYILDLGVKENEILVTTFTTQAAFDIKSKLHLFLGSSTSILVSTIDSICLRGLKDMGLNTQKYHVSEYSTKFQQLFEQNRDIYSNIKYVFVDEFQDINETQFKIISNLESRGCVIFGVGDTAQNIYRFRGANSIFMTNFFENSQRFTLTKNYRSTKSIIEFSNAARSNFEKNNMITHIPNSGPTPYIHEFETSAAQWDGIIKYIRQLVSKGVHLEDIVILSPTRRSLKKMEAALLEANIDVILFEKSFSYSRKPQRGYVSLSTIHGSKGLEWDVVILLEMADTAMPRFTHKDGLYDSRRLFYTAITRAKHALLLCYVRGTLPTRFLTEIPIELYDHNFKNAISKDQYSDKRPPIAKKTLDQVICHLNGNDYQQLRENDILPSDLVTCKTVGESSQYSSLIHREHVFEELSLFVEVFFIRSLSKWLNLVENKIDPMVIELMRGTALNQRDYQLYSRYQRHLNRNMDKVLDKFPTPTKELLDQNKVDIQSILSCGFEKKIPLSVVLNLNRLIPNILEKARNYALPWRKVKTFETDFKIVPKRFQKRIQNSCETYSNFSLITTDILDAILDIAICHSVLLKKRCRLLYSKSLTGKKLFNEHKAMFATIHKFITNNFVSKEKAINDPITGRIICRGYVQHSFFTHFHHEFHVRYGNTIMQLHTSPHEDLGPDVIVNMLALKAICDSDCGDSEPIRNIMVLNPLLGKLFNIDLSGWDKGKELLAFLDKLA
ncbi:P-loop containing nucleoside triphosphate hydrolase protein [Globomyces pollinis-pini]|nr:P-loop containing nucleoside triphosphate hydrolase protein [Globomyces pollinis-pini]